MDIREIKGNKLRTILQFSVPSIIAMLLQTAITITDGYFTGNYVGENALAAINLGLPILYFYLGVGLCVGVGGTVICGRLLGAEEKHKAFRSFCLWYIRRFSAGGFQKRVISWITDRYLIYIEISEKTDIWKLISVFR